MTIGFTVGKFYPPHRGHKLLIDTGHRQVDHMIVMVAHHASQKIAGELRRDWLRELHPDCDIRLVPDNLADDSQEWADFIVSYLGRAPDVVFSSEDYGPRYAALMGSQHVMVDQQRGQINISGSQIRANPLNHLNYLEPCVRAYFVRRIVLIGAESTGKTTLAQYLAQHFNTQWVAEFGREHWEHKVKGFSMTDPTPTWISQEFIDIAREQQRRENIAARSANKLLFCDTNAFATGTWFERYLGTRNAMVDAIGSQDKVDAYLVCGPDAPFVQDGFRDGEKIRGWMHERFIQQLDQLNKPYEILTGPFAERNAQAIAIVETILKTTQLTLEPTHLGRL